MRSRPAANVESGGKNSGAIRIANQSNGPSDPPLGQPRRQAQDPAAQDEDKSSNTSNNSGELRVISSAWHRCWSIRSSQRLKARCSLRATQSQQSPVGVGVVSQRLIPTGERSGLQRRIATAESFVVGSA